MRTSRWGRLIDGRTWSSAVGVLALLVIVALAGCSTSRPMPDQAAAAPLRVIIDTDLSLYWDDATAVGMANVLQRQGKVQVLGVMSDIRNPVAVAAIDAIDTAYGHSRIPVGAVLDSPANTAPHGYSDTLAESLPHSIRDSEGAVAAVPLCRRLLAGQPDRSVTVVSIGGYTNLAQLLSSRPGQGSPLDGRDLVAAKVKRLVIEDGLFPAGGPAFTNERLDVPATLQVVGAKGWPTPIAWVDGYDGIQTKVGGMLCTAVPPSNPMRIVYEALFGCGPPGDGDWDGPTMLYAVGGRQGIFSVLGQGGRAVVNAQGGLSWANGLRPADEVYVHVADQAALNDRINALIDTR
ncbi:MAG TPA: nucleoside hydrolase [Acidimicrobiales bacterium]|nr:nucleoside hydrolase [Acidimicrobiales bacterium]